MSAWLAVALAFGGPQAQADLLSAARKGDLAEIRSLVAKGVDVNARNQDGMTPLLFAVFESHDEAAQTLIAAGANVNATTKQGMTALMYAGIKGRAPATNSLLAAGADARARDSSGFTALLYATSFRSAGPAQISALIRAGADVNAKGPPRGSTALMWAANRDAAEITRELIKAGADLNARQEGSGWTPLMRAAVAGSPRAAKVLLQAGADRSLTDAKGKTAAALADANGHADVARLIRRTR